MAVPKLDHLIALLDVPFFKWGERVQVEGVQSRPEINLAEGYVLWRNKDSVQDMRYCVALKLREGPVAPRLCFLPGKYLKRGVGAPTFVRRIVWQDQRSFSFEIRRAQRLSQHLMVIPSVAVVLCSINLQVGLQNARIVWPWAGSNHATDRRQIIEHIIEHGLAIGH